MFQLCMSGGFTRALLQVFDFNSHHSPYGIFHLSFLLSFSPFFFFSILLSHVTHSSKCPSLCSFPFSSRSCLYQSLLPFNYFLPPLPLFRRFQLHTCSPVTTQHRQTSLKSRLCTAILQYFKTFVEEQIYTIPVR